MFYNLTYLYVIAFIISIVLLIAGILISRGVGLQPNSDIQLQKLKCDLLTRNIKMADYCCPAILFNHRLLAC